MNSQRPHQSLAARKGGALRNLLSSCAACVVLASSVAACAASPDYNPDNLGPAQMSRVSDICQSVMGLNPSEPLSGGYWLGNSRLDYWSSHYRGCVMSLSDSLASNADEQAARQSDEDCRAKGFKAGSPDLALCVLRTVNQQPDANAPAVATPVSEKVSAATGSFFYASARDTHHREQVACAALGFEPTQAGFGQCVKSLNDTFYALDNPIN